MLTLIILGSFVAPAARAPSAPKLEPVASVIVRHLPHQGRAAQAAVRDLDGNLVRRLPIINGFAAEVPSAGLEALARVPAVTSIDENRPVEMSHSVSGYDAKTSNGSLYNTRRVIGALDMVDRGYTGKGVDVALIDSGVVPVNGLDAPGQVVHGPDLSFEGAAPNLAHLDTFGHGTHMAGIIAGRDGSPRSCLLILCSGTGYQNHDDADGIAPEARIVSVKVANAMGATDVSQVIAAIDWVVQHRRDNGLNIRVMNLSFGTDGVQDYRVDPLAYAAEVAWRKGIVVVAAGGNSGYGTPKLNNPAYDPYVIAVGAADSKGTTDTADDVVPEWSSKGNSAKNPDFVAPGLSITSFRAPNSFIDQNYPAGRVNSRFTKGSGTSQAAAVATGAVALLLDHRPTLTPDQVKALLMNTAGKVPNSSAAAQGSGRINVSAARAARVPSYVQTWEPSTGTGSLEAARGTTHVVMEQGEVTGEQDAQGISWDGNQWSADSWAGRTWSGGSWSGNQWSGGQWNGNQWSGNQWSGNQWSGNQWSGNQWSGNQWSGNQWSGNQWSGNQWSGGVWSSLGWN
jgi:serine protease AprX